MEGLVESRPGLGTFIVRTLADDSLLHHESLRSELIEWIRKSRAAGLTGECIDALFNSTVDETHPEAQP